MSRFGDIERTRLRLNFMDSPSFAEDPGPGYSPVTNLALNLNETNLSATPRRKLSSFNIDDTPTHQIRLLQSDLSDVHMESRFSERLLKNVIKLPVSPSPLSRRFAMSPLLTAPHAHAHAHGNNKENCQDSSPCVPASPALSSSSSPLPALSSSPLPAAAAAAAFLSPTKTNAASASAQHVSPPKFASPLRMRQPLEDHDPNSQDSGYSPVLQDKEDKAGFRFTEPTGLAPRRQLSIEQSPCKDMLTGSPRSRSSGYGSPPFFHSPGSGSGAESVDDGFMEFLEADKSNEDMQFPSGMGSLLSCPLKERNSIKRDIFAFETKPRTTFRRSLSLNETSTRGPRYPFGINKEREETVTLGEAVRVFKRPEPPCSENAAVQCLKRPKINPMPIISEDLSAKAAEGAPTVRLHRSFSLTEATIKRALQRSSQEPDLIGDFSKPFVLPLMEGRHQDLKTISSETLAQLMRGEFDSTVDSFTIIDCRYPYEFSGGHIKGAKNVFTQDQIYKEFVDAKKSKPAGNNKRDILIFHCEFSSERGPKLSRFLRNSDRVLNKESYPALHYPEVYLLHGGYKEFFEQYSELCEPCSYKTMLDPGHEADLRLFRSKSKSGDGKNRLQMRSSLKRLGL